MKRENDVLREAVRKAIGNCAGSNFDEQADLLTAFIVKELSLAGYGVVSTEKSITEMLGMRTGIEA